MVAASTGGSTGVPMTAAEALRRVRAAAQFSSGSAAIDSLLGGGYKEGHAVEFFGASKTGKTQLAMQAVMLASRKGVRSLYVDTEGAFRPERIIEMASSRGWDHEGLLDRITYLRADTAAAQTDAVRRIHGSAATSSVKLVVIDTLTRNFSLDFPGSANTPRRQGSLEVHLSDILRDAFLHGRAYVLANRVTFSERDQDVHIGGQTLSQMVDSSVQLVRAGDSVHASVGGKTVECHITPKGFE